MTKQMGKMTIRPKGTANGVRHVRGAVRQKTFAKTGREFILSL
jgi:hypothetical protein